MRSFIIGMTARERLKRRILYGALYFAEDVFGLRNNSLYFASRCIV
jgi:hypothetical protein